MKFLARLSLPLLLLASSCGYREVGKEELAQLKIDGLSGSGIWYHGREDTWDYFSRTSGSAREKLKIPIADSPVMTLSFPLSQEKIVPLSHVTLTKITPTRQPMDLIDAMSCRALTAEEVGPHSLAEYEIFVNGAASSRVFFHNLRAESAMTPFPCGTVFHKTKFHTGEASHPHLATQMTKVANSGQASDWKYEVFELPSGKVLPSKTASCIGCHEDWAAQDFISPEGWAALRQSQSTYLGQPPPWQAPAQPWLVPGLQPATQRP